jgi:hypothetical protein
MPAATESELLTAVGPATPMGSLMREYWIPAAPAPAALGREERVVRRMPSAQVTERKPCSRIPREIASSSKKHDSKSLRVCVFRTAHGA